MAQISIFLSTVTAEFRSYRDGLRHSLDRPNVTVKVQEDFIATGTETLEKLDEYIQECDAVVHLVGDMTGAWAKAPSIEVIKKRYQDFDSRFPMLKPFLEPNGPSLSYTQWEAWLALYHHKVLLIAVPQDDAPRDDDYQLVNQQQVAQQRHLVLLKEYERYSEIPFTNFDNLASELWRSKLHDIVPQLQAPIVERAREMASSLANVGRSTWKIPLFVAPLNLEAKEELDSEPNPTTLAILTEKVREGSNLVLFGEGGIGKTTLLLELTTALLAKESLRIPIYIDAAYWARSNTEILEHIESSPAAKQYGITADELVKLAESGCLTLVVNGWNEMPSTQKVGCFERFNALTVTFPSLNIVVVTRSVLDIPEVKFEQQIHVRGLTWQSQSKVIQSELDKDTSVDLIERLAQDMNLRHAARNPLILKGLIAQAKKGEVTSSCVFDLLGAVIDGFEEDEKRRLLLEAPPLEGLHRHYLNNLAIQLTSNQETSSSRKEVLPVISTTAQQLIEGGQIGSRPRLSEVLGALGNHHLLQVDDQNIRFAHQRFQEYFTATQLLNACVDGGKHNVELLRKAVNQPFWEDALRLVGGKLKGGRDYARARSLLITIALEVDLGFACDLAGVCALSEADNYDLYHSLISQVNLLCDSSMTEVANYGVVCSIASGFTVFSDRLWPLLENDDQSTRLSTYRMNNGGISLKQLGNDAEMRIMSWPPDRQVEVMHELSDNSDNYDFLIRTANEAVDNKVRAAAISALAWNFPASEAALQAWFSAPMDVQVEQNIINVVAYALEEGGGSTEVREKFLSLAQKNKIEKSQLKLALDFHDEVDKSVIEVMLVRLRELGPYDHDEQLVALALKHAPNELKALAQELILSMRDSSDWVSMVVVQESAETRATIFEAAWGILHSEDASNLNINAIGPLANREQILRSIHSWIRLNQEYNNNLSETDNERKRQIGYLLARAPGDELLSIVVELGDKSSYSESSGLLELILGRIGLEGSSLPETIQWLPSPESVHTLIATFGNKLENNPVPQNEINVLLCRIASHVAPDEFGTFLIDGCRLELDSWELFSSMHDEWLKNQKNSRPSNPSKGNYLASSMENWGFGALSGLLGLLDHPYANELIPRSIIRIVSGPWSNKNDGRFWFNISNDFQEGLERGVLGRTLLQPDDVHQEMTDIVAIALGKNLTELVEKFCEEKASKKNGWNEKRAAHYTGALLGIVSSIPSPEIIKPVMHTLINGRIDIYSAVRALRGLVRQGAFIEDADVVTRIEALYAEEAKAEWFDDSKKNVMAEFCQLMFYVRPASILDKTLSDYLVEWQRFAHPNELIRHLGSIQSKDSWHCLLELGRYLIAQNREVKEIAFSLATSLRGENFEEFLEIIKDGTWFEWCDGQWDLERRVAPEIYRFFCDDSVRIDLFLDACERSDADLSDSFACAVLALIPDGDSIRMRYGLAALDAGRVGGVQSSVYSMLKSMFTLHEPLHGDGHYEVHPKSCNALRNQLYYRAREGGSAATVSRLLLADVENQRRESGRPSDEYRHPSVEDGQSWTEALVN